MDDRTFSELDRWREAALALEADVRGTVVGQARPIRLLLIALFARGHVLLEGDVGVGKTTLLRALSKGIGGGYQRLEGTIDLLPHDLIYHTYLDENGQPRVDPGPLLRHGEDLAVFFFNEVNRARPQVHSLLLRVMEERTLTAFNREHRFPHLQVFADRNRVEKEETFELPSAARDRFLMEISIRPPESAEDRRALMFDSRFHDVDRLIEQVPTGRLPYDQLAALAPRIQDAVSVSDTLQDYGLRLWQATREPAAAGVALENVDMDRLMVAGASPRGVSLLIRAARVAAWLAGRDYVLPDDVREIFPEVMTHRLFFTPAYERRRDVLGPQLSEAILQRVPSP